LRLWTREDIETRIRIEVNESHSLGNRRSGLETNFEQKMMGKDSEEFVTGLCVVGQGRGKG